MSGSSTRRVRQARIARFADETSRRVERSQQDGASGNTPDSQLRVILRQCGIRKRSASALIEIEDALLAEAVITNPRIIDPTLKYDQRIYFLRSSDPPPPPVCRFPNERSLEDFISMNFTLIPAFKGLELLTRQYKLPSGQRVDLLCRDTEKGELVVVELKHDNADQRVVAQVFQYLEELRRRAKSEQVGLRAMLVTAECDHALRRMIDKLATASGFPVSWHTYSTDFRLGPAITGYDASASQVDVGADLNEVGESRDPNPIRAQDL